MDDSQNDNQSVETFQKEEENMSGAEIYEAAPESANQPTAEASGMAIIDDDEDSNQNQEQDDSTPLPIELLDHDYNNHDSTRRPDPDSQEFPEIPPLDIFDNSSNSQELDSSRIEKPYYENSTVYSSRGGAVLAGNSGTTVRSTGDSRRLLMGGQQFVYSHPPRAFQHSQRTSEYATTSYTSPGFQPNSAGNIRRISSTPSGGSQAPINVRKSLPMQRPNNSTPMNKTMTRVMPPSIPQAEPPHRALLTGKQAPGLPSNLVYQPQIVGSQGEDSVSAPRGGAPLLVAGRGAKPMMRGRGSAGTVRRKDGDGDEDYDERLGRASPRKVNFIDGIAPGGATMTSPSGTVNLVVGAPPHGAINLYGRSEEHSFHDADAAVQENLQAIQQSLEGRDPRTHQHKEPLPVVYMNKLNDGEFSFRTMTYEETLKLKNTAPDIPPDPVPEPRPRGRPRGSTNRSRLSSQNGTSTIIATESTSPRRVGGKSPPMKPAGNKSPVKGSFVMVEEIDHMPPLVPPPLPAMVANIAPPLVEQQKDKEIGPAGTSGLSPEATNYVTESSVPSDDSDDGSDYSHTTAEEQWGEYTTRCWCDMTHNDDNMIECDKCKVWQHMRCMGVSIAKAPEDYLCEKCEPRKLKLNKEQAREYQERKQAELLKETVKRRNERKKRNEDRKKRKEARRVQKLAEHAKNRAKRSEALRPVSGLQFRKYTEIKENEYSDRAKKLLQRFPSTQGASHVVQNVRSAELKYGRMFVAPGVEGLVAIKDIPKNDLVIEYLGYVSSPSECPGREKEGYVQPHCVLYSGVAVDLPLVIDARRKGGDSRYVRRSCRPNTVLKHVVLDGRIHVLLNATEAIEKSAEITIPFDSDYQKCPRPLACACGDDACCPIADFNTRALARSPTPTPKRKASTGPASKKTTPVVPANKPTPSNKKSSNARGAKPVGRRPMIKLRRHESKEARDSKENTETNEEEEENEDQGSIKNNRATRAARRSDQQTSSLDAPTEAASERRETRRQRKEVEEEPKDVKVTVTPTKAKGRAKSHKEEQVENEPDEETEEKPRRGRSTATAKQPKKEEKDEAMIRSPNKSPSRLRSRTEVNYTLSDKSKMTREERKLQQELAIFEKLEHKDKNAAINKSKSPSKDHKDTPLSGKRSRRGSEKSGTTTTRERTLRDRPSKASPHKENVDKELSRSPISSPPVIPPRKRWQMEQRQKEEEEAAATTLATPPPDFSQGRKAFLLKRAQADREKEEPAPPDPAPSSPQAVPPQNFVPPLKKRRHMETDVSEPTLSTAANRALLSSGNSTHKSPTRRVVDGTPRELLKDLARGLPSEPFTSYELKEGSEWPQVSQAKKKKLSLDEYKRRRTGTAAPSTSTDTEPAGRVAGKKSFIPNIHDADNAPAHLAPVPDPRSISSDSPLTDLDELKKRVYGFMGESASTESRLDPPPPLPLLRSPVKQQNKSPTVHTSEEAASRMSIADRLRIQFGHLM